MLTAAGNINTACVHDKQDMVASDEGNMIAEPAGCPLREGGTYLFISQVAKHCIGHKYRLHRFVTDVPSYQRKVLVEALTGPDTGMWFTVTPDNFARRYRELTETGSN